MAAVLRLGLLGVGLLSRISSLVGPLAEDAVIGVDAHERELAQEERDLKVISRVARLKLAAFKRLKRVLGGYG